MTQRHLLVFTFLVSFVLNAYSAIELRSTQMRTSDGLPNNSIRYIYQDSKGFLWLATLNGLSRYDGNSFLTFRPEAGDKVSLADNRIYDLTEDKDGFLWISTTPELYSCYDLQRARFVDYTGCGELIYCICYSQRRRMVITSRQWLPTYGASEKRRNDIHCVQDRTWKPAGQPGEIRE